MDYMRVINMSIVAVYTLTMLVLAPTMTPAVAVVGFISAATIFMVGSKVDKGIRESKPHEDAPETDSKLERKADLANDALTNVIDKYRQEVKDVRWAVGVDQFGKIVTEHVHVALIEGPIKGEWINAEEIVFEHIKRGALLSGLRFKTKSGDYSDLKVDLDYPTQVRRQESAAVNVTLALSAG